MSAMLNLLWNPFSINYLVQLILVSMMAVYFSVRVRADVKSGKVVAVTGSLLITFAALFVNMLLQFLRVTVHPDQTAYVLPWISPVGAVALCGFVQFAYRFSTESQPKSWASCTILALSIAFVSLEIIVGFQRQDALITQGLVDFRPAWMDLPYVFGFSFALLAFFRHLARAIGHDESQTIGRSILTAGAALTGQLKPLGHRAAAARAFLLVSAMPLLLVIVFLLRSYGLLDPIVSEFAACWMFLLIISTFALVYLNYVPERSSYRVKLVGISLTTMLAILSGTSWVIGPVYVDAYEHRNLVEERTALRFEPSPDGVYAVARTAYRFDNQLGKRLRLDEETLELPFEFPFFGKTYKQIHLRLDGLVGLDYAPLWRDAVHRFGPQPALYPLALALDGLAGVGVVPTAEDGSRGLFAKRENGRVIVTWNLLHSPFHPNAEYSFQLVLYPDGVIEVRYKDLPEGDKPDLFIPLSTPMMIGITPGTLAGPVETVRLMNDAPLKGAPGAGLMDNYRLDFLLYLNRVYAPVAFFILGASLLILILFPVFFQVNLVQPLAKLLEGVQEFRRGKLSISIPVAYRDEIGSLTQSFNEMAQDQKNLIETLEDKVAKRTVAATRFASENARLEERNHLSRELHDAVSQTLFSATLIADTLPSLWKKNPGHAKKALNEMRKLNRSALSEMRGLLLELRPSKILIRTFGSLLRELAEKNIGQAPVTVQIESDLILPEKVQLAFYRIAQECLNNIAKHAKASEIVLYFDGLTSQAMMVISDNGCGFALDDRPPGHMGLQIMQERMTEIGGSIEIKTIPGDGTSVTVIWFQNDSD